MKIREMFKKKIDRPIQGVVKVGQDDDERVKQELDEYVVTNELYKHISHFFSSYKQGINHSTDKIGVWISGFFGSGKSHFLKILSYLVENREVGGKKAISFFDDKIKDPVVLADLKLAGDVPTDVILFDIDAKSESDSKTDKDSIVKVLNKVFNELQGFCGSIPWIADIERQMAKDGKYESFKAAFKRISGNEWEAARDDFYYEEDAIIEALCEATQMSEASARNWFERAEQDYTISIERFANRVKEYIDAKGHDHHVVFFVDEVGQYIGDNSQSMLNLQTVVHEFGRQCHGQAWIVVTSQEDIDSVLDVKGNDFSKIQGRFDTKLSLSSAFVDEVIKKRILQKNGEGKRLLQAVYQEKDSILRNLLTFSDNSAEMKKYRDEQDFIDVYPFVPYQFNLLQKVFTGVRIHGASGKHLAEGERSLLSAFQESAVRFADGGEGLLVPFSAFYETIETFLDSSIRSVIIHASMNEHLTSADVDVLKLLFLIKYVKEVPANLDNLATLMVSDIDEDKLQLKKQIGESLNRLIKQTLIQKNGEEYVFLTNEEQDVNREIKNMHVETSEIIQKIGEEIFDGIYPNKKYRYSAKYNFPFNAMIDDRPIGGQTSDIGLRVLTPYYDAEMDLNSSQLKMMSMRENNIILCLPQETSYFEEMKEILKIQAYLKLKSGLSFSQTIEDIKVRKSREVTERKERAGTSLIEAIKVAEIYANGEALVIKEKNPVDRINEAFHALIKNLYNKLDYVTVFVDTKNELNELLKPSAKQLSLLEETAPNQLALKEVDSYVERMTARRQQMTIKSITAHFSEKPYGWLELDTTALLIKLFMAQDIKLMLNSTYLQNGDSGLLDIFTKRDIVDRVVVNKREKISPALLKTVKDLSQILFDKSALPTDEDGLMRAFKLSLSQERDSIEKLIGQYQHAHYPGKDVLEDGLEVIQDLIAVRDASTFYRDVRSARPDLEDYAERVKDVKGFFDNQRGKYDKALKRLDIFEKNRTYVTNQAFLDTVTTIEKIVNNVEPYAQIQQLPALCEAFDDHFLALIEKECEPIKKDIDSDLAELLDELDQHPELKGLFAADFREQFIMLKERLEQVNNVFEAIAMRTESDRLKVRCFNQIQREIARRQPPIRTAPTDHSAIGAAQERQAVAEPAPVYHKKTKTLSKQMMLRGTKTFETKADIDAFINELRKKLEDELEEDTIIKLV